MVVSSLSVMLKDGFCFTRDLRSKRSFLPWFPEAVQDLLVSVMR